MKVRVHATPENTKSILDLMETQGIKLPCNCHGKNACGGKQYDFPCHMVPHEDITVSIRGTRNFDGLSLEGEPDRSVLPDTLLIDLGTTTVAMVFFHAGLKSIYHKETFPNPQIAYGADVISRIRYDLETRGTHTLQHAIQNKLSEIYNSFAAKTPGIHIRTCLIGANTTMTHLLLGYPLDGMAGSPFTPHPKMDAYHVWDGTDVIIFPWLSAFIGGDVLAGMLHLQFDRRTDTCLLADLGTNGELALLYGGNIFLASTAAGPALEGGGLSCGCPAIPGAVSDIALTPVMAKLTTIQNKLPAGICGSGAISLLAQLISHGYLTPDGVLTEKFPKDGLVLTKTASAEPIRFTKEDVRQIQLATAAVGAGIETLCQKAGIQPCDIETLYLAGGLGYHINIEQAQKTGMFSGVSPSRIRPVGNSCLLGLADLCGASSDMFSERIRATKKRSFEIILADEPCFQSSFIRHMSYSDNTT